MRPLLIALAFFPAWLPAASQARAARPPSLERGLVRQAPGVIEFLRAKGYKNVGVLKFEGPKGLADNVGRLNFGLADRFQVALVLANDLDTPIGIIRDANDEAFQVRGANHQSAEGRQALFARVYRLAWGKEKVKADAFVTGRFTVNRKDRTLRIELFVIDRDNKTPVGKPFQVSTSPAVLGEQGRSFRLRKPTLVGLADERTVVQSASQSANRIEAGKDKHPLQERDFPVKLECWYNRKPQKIDFRDGKAFVREPRPGEEVWLVPKRENRSKKSYGVVVKVNGESTLFRQRDADDQCLRWILGPKAKPRFIKGYQLNDGEIAPFRVLAEAEVPQRSAQYGRDLGIISVSVYVEGTDDDADEPQRGDEKGGRDAVEDRNVDAVSRMKLPSGAPTLGGLRHRLVALGTKGPVVPDDVRKNDPIRRVKFKNPRLVGRYSVIYYKKSAADD